MAIERREVAEHADANVPGVAIGRGRRLAVRIILLLFPLSALVVLLTQIATGIAAYRSHAETLETHAKVVADLTSNALTLPLWNLDMATIAATVSGLDQDPALVAGSVVDPDGLVVHAIRASVEDDSDTFTVQRHIYAPESSKALIGQLILTYSERTLTGMVNRQIFIGAIAFVVLLVSLTIATLLVLRGTVLKPLNLLLGAIASVERGAWSTVNWSKRDEIGRVVGAFNTMVEGLKAGEAARQALDLERERAEAIAREAQLARESEERLLSILGASPFPFVINRFSDEAVIYRNPRAERMFGIQATEGTDFHAGRFWRNPEERKQILAFAQTTGAVEEFETQLMDAGGDAFYAIVSAVAMSYSGEPCCLMAFNDITARKRAEDELLAAKTRAETALDQLKRTQASLVEAEKMASLGGLVAGVAHEINTPIGVALTAVTHFEARTREIVEASDTGKLKKSDFARYLQEGAETAKLLIGNITRAAELIRSFKQVAVDQTSETPRRFRLKEYIEEIVTSLKPQLRKSGGHSIEIDCDAKIEMDGYPGPFAQVLTNLIVNSTVHAYEPGQVGKLKIKVSETGEGRIWLVYKDDGKGIPAENLSRVFDPFFTTKRGAGGTGLGLHIVYNIVKGKLKGDITVSSTPGKGVAFTLDLPSKLE